MRTLNEAESYTQVLLRITRKQSEPPRIVVDLGEVRGPRSPTDNVSESVL